MDRYIGRQEHLLTIVKRRKLQWSGNVDPSCSDEVMAQEREEDQQSYGLTISINSTHVPQDRRQRLHIFSLVLVHLSSDRGLSSCGT